MAFAAMSGARAQSVPPTPAPRGVLLTWDAGKDRVSRSYDAGPSRLTWSVTPASAGLAAPTVSDRRAGRNARFRFTAQAGSSLASATFGYGMIDPKAGPNQILVSTYTGGAHCCNQLDLLEERAATSGVMSRSGAGMAARSRNFPRTSMATPSPIW